MVKAAGYGVSFAPGGNRIAANCVAGGQSGGNNPATVSPEPLGIVVIMTSPSRRLARCASLALLVLAVAGCTYRAGLNDFSGSRWVGWFSYVSASDIHQRCTAGRDVYRLVYNGNWAEEVHTFDLRPSATGEGAILDERVFQGSAGFTFGTRVGTTLSDPLASFETPVATTRLSNADFRALTAALAADGLGQPGPAHARLNSWDYYWVAAACLNGRFVYNAWIAPTPRFAALTFPGRLQAVGTRRPVNAPRRSDNPTFDPDRTQDGRYSTFTIQLDGAGLPLRLPTL